MGRKPKRKHIRNTFIKVRSTEKAKQRLKNTVEIMKTKVDVIISEADVVEWAVKEFQENLLRKIEEKNLRQIDILEQIKLMRKEENN